MSAAQTLEQARYRFRSRLAQPVYRSGYTLVLNSTVTAVVGVGFWLLAARRYSPAVVGRNSAALSAMMLLAGIAQLNLMSSLLRFVPAAGRGAGRMVARSYVVAACLSAVAAVGFLAGLHVWAPALTPLLRTPATAISFVVATAGCSVLVLQTSAFVAVGRAGTATLANQAFNVLKVLLLFGFAAWLPDSGVYFSWVTAGTLVVMVGAWFLFTKAMPAFSDEPSNIPALSDFARFAAPDYVASLSWIAATTVVPILVLNLTGAAHAAVFALLWSVCLVLYGVPESFGQALVAHTSREPAQLDERHGQLVRSSLALLTPAVAVLVLGAPILLHPFGPWYASQGTGTLRLLALSALPGIVVTLTVSHARVRRHMVTVTSTLGGLCVLTLGLTLLLVPRMGIAGAALAWLLSQTAVATLIGLERASRRIIRSPRGPVPAAVRARALRTAGAAGWHLDRRLPTASDTAVLLVSKEHQAGPQPQQQPEHQAGVLKVASSAQGIAALAREREVLSRLASEDRLGAWRQMLPAVLDSFETPGALALLTSRIDGRDGRSALAQHGDALAAATAIEPLHRLDSAQCPVDEQLLSRWVGDPVARLRATVSPSRRLVADTRRLESLLNRQLSERTLTLGWVHGDFHAGNLLLDGRGAVCGILDPGQAQERDLPVLDLAHWLLTLPGCDGGRPIGARVAARLGSGPGWSEDEMRFLSLAPGGGELPGPVLLLLSWLRHVDTNLVKSDRYRSNVVWLRRNVIPVLRKVPDE